MEKIYLDKDIHVFCTTAASFPDGIQDAFLKLEQLLSMEGRTFYGLSQLNKEGTIIYKAAVTESFPGETEQYGFENFIIPRGYYSGEKIVNWKNNIPLIGKVFMTLVKDPRMNRDYPCIEWYHSEEELTCMVKLKEPVLN